MCIIYDIRLIQMYSLYVGYFFLCSFDEYYEQNDLEMA